MRPFKPNNPPSESGWYPVEGPSRPQQPVLSPYSETYSATTSERQQPSGNRPHELINTITSRVSPTGLRPLSPTATEFRPLTSSSQQASRQSEESTPHTQLLYAAMIFGSSMPNSATAPNRQPFQQFCQLVAAAKRQQGARYLTETMLQSAITSMQPPLAPTTQALFKMRLRVQESLQAYLTTEQGRLNQAIINGNTPAETDFVHANMASVNFALAFENQHAVVMLLKRGMFVPDITSLEIALLIDDSQLCTLVFSRAHHSALIQLEQSRVMSMITETKRNIAQRHIQQSCLFQDEVDRVINEEMQMLVRRAFSPN